MAYYVAKTGSDSNNGSQSSPWLTIQHAATTAQAGSTVYVGAGTYSESVTFANSGTASTPIVFNGQGVAIVDGTSVSCCGGGDSYASGLFSISNLNYLTIEGFTIQNYKTSSSSYVPAGIDIYGYGDHISILNNTIKNIQTTGGASGNAYGISVHGTSSTPISNLTVSGNTVTGCETGQSETTTYNGNVQTFVVSNNTIYGNDNIGMDAIGFEGTGPSGSDQAKAGDVYGNLIYNNSAINNPGEQAGGQNGGYDEDGLYCDGCTQVVFERNEVYGNDIGIEAASENSGKLSSYVIIRNNLIYGSNSCGVTIGGYASSGTGGSDHITIVNNSLYSNTNESSAASGEFQTQWRVTNSVFENNIVYAGSSGMFIVNQTSGAGITADYNDYYTTASSMEWDYNGTAYSTFASYQTASKMETHSKFANPGYTTLPTCSSTYTPIGGYTPASTAYTCSALGNTDLTSSSPALNTGNTALGTPSGSSWSAYQLSEPYVGSTDFNGNPRVNASGQINMGAYEQ